jgi:hypothetical protein
MNMGVVEAGRDDAPLKIDPAHLCSGEFLNFCRSPHRDDALATNGDSFGERLRYIGSENFTVKQD